ncbi:MAG: arylesterase [Alphaproteobacteria bacterium]
MLNYGSGVLRAIAALLLVVFTVPLASAAAQDGTDAAGPAIRILGLGDSLMAGYGLPPGEGFVEQLEAALAARGHDVAVINAGVSGDTTAGGRARLAWSLADPVTHAIVELGANDALRGLEPAETEANLRAILTTLKAEGIPVLLCGMLAPRNLGPDYAAEFDALYPRLAAEFGVVFYPFFLEGVAREAALNQPDGIHPNRAGVERIVDRILPFVEQVIAR